MKLFFIGLVVIVVLVLSALVFLPSGDTSDSAGAISRTGLHWHPQLEIYVRGEQVIIAQNVGLGAVHNPVHTHEDLPILHLEFSGLVTEEHIKLGNFFKVWGKDMRSFGENMRMTVNGKENTEYEKYVMHDDDKIELHYD